MNINDLSFVIEKTLENVSENDLLNKYQQLINSLSSLQSSPSQEAENSLTEVRNDVVSSHKRINSSNWTFARKAIFKELNYLSILGSGGINFIRRTFNNNISTNNQTIIQNLQHRHSEINMLIQNMNQITSGLGKFGEFKEISIPEDQVYMEVVFSKGVAIKSIKELEKSAKDWVDVFNGYNRLFKKPFGEATIVYLNKINPVIEGFAIAPIIAHIIEQTLVPLIKVRKEWLESQIYAEKLKRTKMKNYFLKKNWELAYEKAEIQAIQEITEKLIKTNEKTIPDGTINEVTGFVKHNTEFISNFVKNGGLIDVTAKSKGNEFTAKLKLSSSYAKIFKLEEKAKSLLEQPKIESGTN